jgi:CDGSH-type Zn-finger protein
MADTSRSGPPTGPIAARTAPYQAGVEAGRTYYRCACGRSARQPFCDGSHAGTDLAPMAWTAEADDDVWFCGCKATADRPLCDGSHASL